jgi:hypothetical protein
VDTNWAEIADHIETIEELYEVRADGRVSSPHCLLLVLEVCHANRAVAVYCCCCVLHSLANLHA